MRNIKFTSLHGVPMHGEIKQEIKIGRSKIAVIYALGRVYAVTNGYSLVEADANVTMQELRELIMEEI